MGAASKKEAKVSSMGIFSIRRGPFHRPKRVEKEADGAGAEQGA